MLGDSMASNVYCPTVITALSGSRDSIESMFFLILARSFKSESLKFNEVHGSIDYINT
jgi:hypothetical protein